MYKIHIFWIAFLSIHYPRFDYADTTADDGGYYTMQTKPIRYEPEHEEEYSGVNAETDCHYVMDLALVFDSSYSITIDEWSKIKENAKKLVNGLDVSSGDTHVFILQYSTCLHVGDNFMFNESVDKGRLSNLIDGLDYCGEWSRLDRALDAVPNRVFSPFNGGRENVPKVVVVFTDGKFEAPNVTIPKIDGKHDLIMKMKSSLVESIKNLRKENITLFGVATEDSNYEILLLIAGNRSRVVDINNIESLVEKLFTVGKDACPDQKEKSVNKVVSSISQGKVTTVNSKTTIHNTISVAPGKLLVTTPSTQLEFSTGSTTPARSLMPTPSTSSISSTAIESFLITPTSVLYSSMDNTATGELSSLKFTNLVNATVERNTISPASLTSALSTQLTSARDTTTVAAGRLMESSFSIQPDSVRVITATSSENVWSSPLNQQPTYVLDTSHVTLKESVLSTASITPHTPMWTVKASESSTNKLASSRSSLYRVSLNHAKSTSFFVS